MGSNRDEPPHTHGRRVIADHDAPCISLSIAGARVPDACNLHKVTRGLTVTEVSSPLSRAGNLRDDAASSIRTPFARGRFINRAEAMCRFIAHDARFERKLRWT